MVAIAVLYLTGPIAAENIGYVDLQKVFINYKETAGKTAGLAIIASSTIGFTDVQTLLLQLMSYFRVITNPTPVFVTADKMEDGQIIDEDVKSRFKNYSSNISRTHGNVEEIIVNDKLSRLAIKDILQKVKKTDLVIISIWHLSSKSSISSGCSSIIDLNTTSFPSYVRI